MVVAVVILSVALAGAIGVIVWLVRRGDSRTDEMVAATQMTFARTLDFERERFAVDKLKLALDSEKRRAAALEDYVRSQAFEVDPHVDLAPDDVAGRILRMSRSWETMPDSTADTGANSADASGSVRPDKPPGTTIAPAVL